MPDDPSFHTLLKQVRAGDQEAAATLVRQYEPEIRRVIRMRLTDPRLRRVVDSIDVCQSVLANFFVRMAAGQFEVESPAQLLKLLAAMARNRLFNQIERLRAKKCDVNRLVADGGEAMGGVAADQASPSRILAGKELLELVRQRLSEEERQIADLRAVGHGWLEIAAKLGGSPEALRKKFSRAIDRVAQDLGLEATVLV